MGRSVYNLLNQGVPWSALTATQQQRWKRDMHFYSSAGMDRKFVAADVQDYVAVKAYARARSLHRERNSQNGFHSRSLATASSWAARRGSTSAQQRQTDKQIDKLNNFHKHDAAAFATASSGAYRGHQGARSRWCDVSDDDGSAEDPWQQQDPWQSIALPTASGEPATDAAEKINSSTKWADADDNDILQSDDPWRRACYTSLQHEPTACGEQKILSSGDGALPQECSQSANEDGDLPLFRERIEQSASYKDLLGKYHSVQAENLSIFKANSSLAQQ
eukprot:3933310-Karenia_brevis.AAC.1